MNNFENDVREALAEFETQPPLDPVAVVKRGKRIRNRRRAMVGLAAAAMVAVVGGISVVPKLGTSTVTTANPDASPSPTTAAKQQSYACPEPGVVRRPEPGAMPLKEHWSGSPGETVDAHPDGDAICTGEFGSKGEAVIYFQAGEGGRSTNMWEGRRDASGKYSGYFNGRGTISGNDGLSPGLHGLTGDGWHNFILGYYVGPAAEVEFIAQGKKMATHLQKWSKNPDVSIFWFRIPGGTDPDRIYDSIYQKPGDVKVTVRDADGRSLPVGDTQVFAI